MIKPTRATTYLVRLFAFFVTCCFYVVVGRTANSVSAYKVTPITPPAGWTSVVPTDINNSGQIVGYGLNGTTVQSFIADTNNFTPIPLPKNLDANRPDGFFISAFALAINNSSQVVGWGDYRDPVLGSPITQVFTSGIGGGSGIVTGVLYNFATDINGSGEIVGHALVPAGQNCRPFEAFTIPSGKFPVSVGLVLAEFGLSINNLGQVAGIAQSLLPPQFPPNNPCPFLSDGNPPQVFLGAAGALTLIPTPTGWYPDERGVISQGGAPTTRNMQINDSEQIVAMVRPTHGPDIVRIALSTRTDSFLIDNPPGASSVARPSLNNLGQVVGQIVGSIGGWVWDSSNGTRLLQDLVSPGWTILSADGINDQGQIVGRASNTSGFSGPVILDPVSVNLPDRPTGLSAICNSASQVTVSWQSVPNATGYYLRINDPSKSNPAILDYSVDNLSQTTFTASVTPGRTYSWWVHAANAGGLSASAQSSFACPAPAADTTAPSISALTVTDITPSSASIKWTTDEPAYGQVEFSSPCPPSGCLTPYVSTMLSSHRVDIANLADSTTYTFLVRVKDASGNASTSTPQSFKTGAIATATPTSAPTAPTNLEAFCNGGAQVSLRWSPVSTAESYDLRINDLSKPIPTPYDYVVDGLTGTTFTANVTPGKQYAWWVHAANAIGLSGATVGTFSCPTP